NCPELPVLARSVTGPEKRAGNVSALPPAARQTARKGETDYFERWLFRGHEAGSSMIDPAVSGVGAAFARLWSTRRRAGRATLARRKVTTSRALTSTLSMQRDFTQSKCWVICAQPREHPLNDDRAIRHRTRVSRADLGQSLNRAERDPRSVARRSHHRA